MQITATIKDRVTLNRTVLNSSTVLPLHADDTASELAGHIKVIMRDPEHVGATLPTGTRVVPTADGILVSVGPSSFDIPWRHVTRLLDSLKG